MALPVSESLSVPAALARKLDEMAARAEQIERDLSDPAIVVDHRRVRDLSIEKSALAPVVEAYAQFRQLTREATELRAAAMKGAGGGGGGAGSTNAAASADAEFAALALAELPEVESRAAEQLALVKSRLVNADDQRVGSVILEVRAGTGGDEASLWARDLLDLYTKYATRKGWKMETLDLSSEPSVGGIRSATINVSGEGVWSDLSFEAGVHSVKRVPATEAQGRIHTSTATVAVLPEPEEVQVKIDWAADVVEDVTTAQGPGGQNVNKVATAVKLVHKPTGIEVRMQESKSQQQNRERARRLLMARVYELERRKVHEARAAARSAQIGSGERSEKIRTYRYKDGIVADERLPGEYPLRDILSGDLERLFSDLREQETQKRLAEL